MENFFWFAFGAIWATGKIFLWQFLIRRHRKHDATNQPR